MKTLNSVRAPSSDKANPPRRSGWRLTSRRGTAEPQPVPHVERGPMPTPTCHAPGSQCVTQTPEGNRAWPPLASPPQCSLCSAALPSSPQPLSGLAQLGRVLTPTWCPRFRVQQTPTCTPAAGGPAPPRPRVPSQARIFSPEPRDYWGAVWKEPGRAQGHSHPRRSQRSPCGTSRNEHNSVRETGLHWRANAG